MKGRPSMRNFQARLLLGSSLLIAAFLGISGCCSRAATATGPSIVRSNEVTIGVYVFDEENPQVVVSPEDAYLEVGTQIPHWLPTEGMVTKIEFGADGNPFGEDVPCGFGHCKAKGPARKTGTFKYSVTVRYRGKDYRLDPRLIVG
jgi:hypothetical protein